MNNDGVSNIVSAFILVLMVVSAAMALAVYVAQEQGRTKEASHSMIDYGLEQLQITPTANTLSFNGNKTDFITIQGAGFLLTNTGANNIQIIGIKIDGTPITNTNPAYGFIVLQKNIYSYTLYSYIYNYDFVGYNATTYWNLSKIIPAWNMTNASIQLVLPKMSIINIMFPYFLLNNLNIGAGSHTLEITSALGRSYTETFNYYP